MDMFIIYKLLREQNGSVYEFFSHSTALDLNFSITDFITLKGKLITYFRRKELAERNEGNINTY